jgi:OOP family OmpA-OmpF porin
MRHVLVALTAASITLSAAASASAQTISYANAVGQLAVACKADIAKYCGRIPLGGARLLQCLNQNADVWAGCKQTIADLTTMVANRAQARVSVMNVCSADISRLCAGIQPGDGNLMQCFFQTRRNASSQCQQVVASAGYETPISPDQPTTQISLTPVDIGLPASSLSAAGLQQMALASMQDPSRSQALNRAPLLSQLNNMAQITIAIGFDFGSARISLDSFKAVGLIADALNSPYLQGYRFLIVGNTDAVGGRDYN